MRDEEKRSNAVFIPHPSSPISAVVVMVKAPRSGLVKTRLTPPLTKEDAASLAACFARDVVNCASGLADVVIIAYAPAGGRAALETTLRRGDLLWLEQQGADLGERLDAAAAHAFARGFGPLVFLGADSPTLPPSLISQAFQVLATEQSDIVLGPTDDGGYYLVGLRHQTPGLFQNVAWSTPEAYAQTARNARRLGLRLHELPRWYDVDTPADLSRLRAELLTDEAARQRAPATYQWLQRRDEG
jgi:rSAM/selenodomain-associated transferase 1